jgi:CDP-diacylglycerol--glycerol-3-phosphate 3-phosphatidyltransferase
MTPASIITLTRIALIPVFMWAVGSGIPYSGVLALIIFIVASATDAVDGYVARRFHQVTNFGKFIDPLADKLLVTAALLMFVEAGRMPAIAAMIIVTREFLITSLRTVAMTEGKVIAAGWEGKLKTVVQIVCIAFLLTAQGGIELFAGVTLDTIAVWLMTAVTVWSGVAYLVRHGGVLRHPN